MYNVRIYSSISMNTYSTFYVIVFYTFLQIARGRMGCRQFQRIPSGSRVRRQSWPWRTQTLGICSPFYGRRNDANILLKHRKHEVHNARCFFDDFSANARKYILGTCVYKLRTNFGESLDEMREKSPKKPLAIIPHLKKTK